VGNKKRRDSKIVQLILCFSFVLIHASVYFSLMSSSSSSLCLNSCFSGFWLDEQLRCILA